LSLRAIGWHRLVPPRSAEEWAELDDKAGTNAEAANAVTGGSRKPKSARGRARNEIPLPEVQAGVLQARRKKAVAYLLLWQGDADQGSCYAIIPKKQKEKKK